MSDCTSWRRIIRLPGSGCAGEALQRVGRRLALGLRQVLDRLEEPEYERPPVQAVRHADGLEARVREAMIAGGEAAHGLDHRVVPHPPAVEVRRSDEEGRRYALLAQDRQRDACVVGVAVVEGDRDRPRRQPAIAELSQPFGQSARTEVSRQDAHLPSELVGGRHSRPQRVGFGADAVIDEYGEPAWHRQAPAPAGLASGSASRAGCCASRSSLATTPCVTTTSASSEYGRSKYARPRKSPPTA